MKDISIIIPTFNEKGSLQELFRRIDNSLDCAYECILVDDNSADGTGEFAEELDPSASYKKERVGPYIVFYVPKSTI